MHLNAIFHARKWSWQSLKIDTAAEWTRSPQVVWCKAGALEGSRWRRHAREGVDHAHGNTPQHENQRLYLARMGLRPRFDLHMCIKRVAPVGRQIRINGRRRHGPREHRTNPRNSRLLA